MATLFEMDAANLFCDDLDPSQSQFLAIEEIRIPSLVEKTTDHSGGGASMGMKMGMGVFEPIELTFKLRGFNPDVMNKIMVPGRARRNYTIMGNIRDMQGDIELPLRCVVRGRMTKVDMGTFQRDKGISTDYQVDEVDHYELTIGGQEKYYINYWSGPSSARVDGVNVYQGMARNIGLA